MPGVQTWKEKGGGSSSLGESNKYRRVFEAFTDEGATIDDVERDRRCPTYLSRDRFGKRGWVKLVTTRQDARVPRLFTVEVEYSLNFIEKNPLDREAAVSWKESSRVVPLTRDIDGVPILNKAGDPMETSLDESFWIANVRKNIRPGPATWLQDYRNSVNKDSVTIDGRRFAPGVLAIRGIRIGEPTEENDIAYRSAQFELWENVDGWQLHLWNRGFYERSSEWVYDQSSFTAAALGPVQVDVKKRILDDAGEPFGEPQFLDGDGRAYRVAGKDGVMRMKHPLDPKDLIWLEFKIKRELPFRALPLR